MDLLLVGGGGHCRSCIDVVETRPDFRIAGIVQPADAGEAPCFGYAILGDDNALPDLVARFRNALVSVGQIKSPAIRIRLFERLRALGAGLPSIASAAARVSPRAELGAGTIVMHGAVVNAAARVGENCIVNSLALIEHDAVVEAHTHVSTGVCVNGGATVGSGTFIGSGAVIGHGVTVGAGSIVGAGSVVLRDLPEHSVVKRPR